MIEIAHVDFCRFIEKVDLHAPGGCWNWTASTRRWRREPWDGGYGAFWWKGRIVRAHLFAYWFYFGKVPSGKVLLHGCDNRLCVNVIDHVRPGTQLENIADMVKKGRHLCRATATSAPRRAACASR